MVDETEYYTQRASSPGTLLITEATQISSGGGAYEFAPGIWTSEQILAWKSITSAVHAKQCKIFCQLWHLGRAGVPAILESHGRKLLSASAVPIDDAQPTPGEMTEEEITEVIAEYATAARNAVEKAGFDGVEIHAANGYLPDQFLQDVCNKRTDAWGGSIEKRARFPLEVTRAVVDAVGAHRTAIRFSPYGTYQAMGMADPIPQFGYLLRQLRGMGLAYLHLVEGNIDGTDDSNTKEGMPSAPLVKTWDNASPVLLCGAFTPESAREAVDRDYKDYDVVVVFGRHFLANPDMVFRLQRGIALNKYDRASFYTPLAREGYIDYPFCDEFLREQRDAEAEAADEEARRSSSVAGITRPLYHVVGYLKGLFR